MSNFNVIKFTNVDSVNSGYQNTSGWFKKKQSSTSASNREVDRHLILRVKNVDDINAVSGVIRFNEEKVGGPVFEGYDGIQWNSFNSVEAQNGTDGLNYKTIVQGENLVSANDSNTNYYSLFKNITTTIANDETVTDDSGSGTDSQVTETIHRLPTFKYDSSFSSKQFNLANHNIIFEPNDTTSYKVYVNKNDSWPPVDYSGHTKYSQLNNGVKLTSNSYLVQNLPTNFKFYNQEYDAIYINQNGYITFGVGESAFVQNLLQNHFSKYRISAMFLNLTDDETSGSSSSYTTLDSDIFLGTGKYGEYVVTFQNYLHNPGTANYRVDFQIRLFLSGAPADTNNLYSDDYYPQGTIQIAYNNNANLTNISPVVGISDSSGYDATIFTELYFSNLLTSTKRVATTETGVPFLRTFLNLQLKSSDSTDITNLNTKHTSTASSSNQDVDSSNGTTNYKLILNDLDTDLITINDTTYGTSYQEDNYYIKTIDLGNVRVQKLSVAIRSDFDYEPKKNNSVVHYSDATNYFINKNGTGTFISNTTLETNWKNIPDDRFIDISSIYSTTNSKDYFNIYDNLATNSNYQSRLYNSSIYRIQAKYQKQMDMSTSTPTLNNNLILKIIYTLNSDTDNNTGTSLSNALAINFNRSLAGDNYGPYHYIKNDTDLFSITRTGTDNASARFIVRIYDYYMTAETSQISTSDETMRDRTLARRVEGSNSNQSLTLELLNSSGDTIATNKPTDTKQTGEVNFQDLKFFNQITKSDPSITEQYYLKITGTHNLGYYGVSLIESIEASSETQVSGVYANHKFSRINGTDSNTALPLTIIDETVTGSERVYSISKSDNLLFLMSDSSETEMRFYNFSFSGAAKAEFKTGSANGVAYSSYNSSQEVLDMQFMGDKVLVARKNGSNQVNVDMFNFDSDNSDMLERTITSSSSEPSEDRFYMRVLNDNSENYGLISYISESSEDYLNLYSFKEGESLPQSLNAGSISGVTGANVLDSIVNLLVFDKDNIFLIGNLGTLTSNIEGKIYKLSYNTSTKAYSQLATKTVAKAVNSNAINKILYADKYESGSDKYIVVFYQEGENATGTGDTGFCISIFSLDLSTQYDQTFEYDGSRVVSSIDNIIFNFKVKYGMILILWEDTSSNRYFQSYKIQLDESTPILKKKTSNAYSSTDFLMDVVLHNITLNSQTENIYVIIRKYLAAEDANAFQLLIQVQKEDETNVIIQFNSTTNYLTDLEFSYSGKSIFNKVSGGGRKFEITNEFNKLIKDPLPITSSVNDEQLFFFGFDSSTKKLILEGFGKLSDVTNTGATIAASNIIKTIGNASALSFNDIGSSNFVSGTASSSNTTTLKYSPTALGNTNVEQEEMRDLLDINSYVPFYESGYISKNQAADENVKNKIRKMETSMATIKKTINEVTTYYTAVCYGPTNLNFYNDLNTSVYRGGDGSYQRFLSGINGTFKFDIYAGDTYIKQDVYTFEAIIPNYMVKPDGKNLEIIPIEDGFLIYFLKFDNTLSGSLYTFNKHQLVVHKFVISSSGEWTRTILTINLGQFNIPLYENIYNGYYEYFFRALRHVFMDDDKIMMITMFPANNKGGNEMGTGTPDGTKGIQTFFINIEDLDYSVGFASLNGSSVKAVNANFNSNINNVKMGITDGSWFVIHPTGTITFGQEAPYGSASGPATTWYWGAEGFHFKIGSESVLYSLEKYVINNISDYSGSLATIIMRKCVKHGDTLSDSSGKKKYGDNYFNAGTGEYDKVHSVWLPLQITNFNELKLQGRHPGGYGMTYQNGNDLAISSVYESQDPLRFLFSNNVVYQDTSNNKFHIYFMALFSPEFFKSGSNYLQVTPAYGQYYIGSAYGSDISGGGKIWATHARIMRFTIEYSSTLSGDTYSYNFAHSFGYQEINNNTDAANYGPTMEKETLIIDNANLAQFNMIKDSDKSYIIASSHGYIYNVIGSTDYVSGTNRENIDFIVYKIKDDGNLVLVCYGKQQRIFGIHIENSNLVLFVPSDSVGAFDSDGKFTRIFKKPLSDINTGLSSDNSATATEIILSNFSPEIIEPENDTTNVLNYPQFFTNVNGSSKFIYSGDTNTYNNIISPTENQTKGKPYNMVIGYNPNTDGSSNQYGDDKSFGITTFGTFATSSSSSEEEEESSSGTTTTTDTSIGGKLNHFNTQLGTSAESNFVIGRYRNTSFNTNEDDTGVTFYAYNNPISLTGDTDNFYVRTNSIPNYEPRYSGVVIKGSWNNELNDSTNANYSIMAQNYGWLSPNTLTENGTYFKIPHTITNVNSKNVLVGSTTISETFWYVGDSGWDAIMVNPGYYDSTATQNTDSSGYYITNTSLVSTNVNDKLMTPIGRIGVGVNGVVFYNFSNLERDKNAVRELKADIFGGMGDSLNTYHYHSWPVNLEGMLDLGHPDTSVQGSDYGRVPTLNTSTINSGQILNSSADRLQVSGSNITFPKFIFGMTYYFNQIARTNYNSTTVNKHSIKFESIFKGTIHRFKVRQVHNEYYLTPIDFAGTTTGSETRRLVISKIKQGDTIIFNHDASCTKLITITNDESEPSTGWGIFNNVSVNTTPANIKTSMLSQIGSAGNDGALTYFNVPYNFDVDFVRYQPSGLSGGDTLKDWGSYIITGSFYKYNVALVDDSSTAKYYTLTPEGGNTIEGTTSPALTNIKFGDLVLFDQPEIDSTYELKIKTGSATSASVSTNALDSANYQKTLLNKITFEATSSIITYSNGNIQINSHGLSTGDPVIYNKGTSAIQISGPTDLTEGGIFYIIRVDSDNIKLATSSSNASSGIALTFVFIGTGVHSLSDIKYLYFAPKSPNSLAKTTLYYTTPSDVSSVVVTGGSITLTKYSRPTELSFNNTLVRHGVAGNSYCPYTKFTIPNFSDIKINKLALKLNSNKYEIYANLNNNRYTLIQTSNIYVKLNVKQTYSVSASDVNILINTITINDHGFITGNILTYTQGTTGIGGLIHDRNYYVIKIDVNTIKLATSEGLASAASGVTFTSTGTGNQTFTIVGITQRYEFYGKFNNTGYYETSSTEKITDLQLFNGTRYIFDVSDSSMNGITLRFSNSNTTFTEVLSYSTADNKITTDITGIANNTLLYAFDSSDDTNTNILGSTIITLKTAHSQFLTELKLFRDTKYIIDVSTLASTQRPKFSTTLPTSSITDYEFPYHGVNTFSHNTTTNLITFTVGDDITSLYLYNSEAVSDVNKGMGSNYAAKIYSEKIYDLLNKIRITDLAEDVTGDSGPDWPYGANSLEANVINVKLNESGNFEFYATDQSADNNHKFDYYVENISNRLTTLKLYNNTKYIIKYSTGMTGTDNILKFTSNATPSSYVTNNIDFYDTYDDSVTDQISFVVKGLNTAQQTIYVYNGKSGQESTSYTDSSVTATLQAQNAKPINIFTDVNSNNFRFFRTPVNQDYFQGYLDYENAENYITKKLTRTGPAGHSPLLGYAFDGYPIYGPLGYDKDDSSYNSSATTLAEQANFKVKLMKSSYTGGNDNDGNPMYIQGSGDLDICNGITLPTPEFPNGIYHYVCTIELNTNGNQKLSIDSNYGYLNDSNTIVKAAYPYVIGAYKGLPEKSNFNTTSTTTTSSATSAQITTYKMNFRSLKSENNKYNGSNYSAIDIYTDDNYLQLCPRPHPYIWNFTSDQSEDAFFGKSNKEYGSTISSLRSSSSDTKFKAYGNVSKWICKETISAGLAVRLVNNTRSIIVNNVSTNVTTLEIELYDSNSALDENSKGAAFLGIALNDATSGNSCFVCTKGITTIKIGNSLDSIKCGAYGTLKFAPKGYVLGISDGDVISGNTPIAGYFLEDLTSVTYDQLILFNVQGNYEFFSE